MGKNNGGMFSFLVGMAAGAGALFLSKEKNRKKAKVVARKVGTRAKTAKAAYDKDPVAFKSRAKAEAKRVAKKTAKKAVAKKTAKKRVAKK
jgi:hypothetical protein